MKEKCVKGKVNPKAKAMVEEIMAAGAKGKPAGGKCAGGKCAGKKK